MPRAPAGERRGAAAAVAATFAFIAAILLTRAAGAATYHVDAATGDDAHAGTSPAAAWRSLDAVNRHPPFGSGDAILFKVGTRYAGRLAPAGSGAVVDGRAVPIVVDVYGGPGPLPRIDAGGAYPEALLLRNVEHWDVRHLELTNIGPTREPWRCGVRVLADGFGAMRNVRLAGLFVHDVNGDLRKSAEGCGIYFETRGGGRRGGGGGPASWFDGLVVEHCRVERTDRNGICQRAGSRARSKGVAVRDNLLLDVGGDGIKIWGSDGAVIERNVIRGGRMRCDDAAAGIWPFASDDTVIQHNEVSGMRGTLDGQAFDADYGCRRTLIQYNYSHDNDGGFLLVCGPKGAVNEGAIVRYNVSANDGSAGGRMIQMGGASQGAQVYNNTIYVGPGMAGLPLVSFNDWDGGWAEGAWFANNLFVAAGRVRYRLGRATGTVFEHNLYAGDHAGRPEDGGAVEMAAGEPDLVKPGAGGDGFLAAGAYQWRAGAKVPVGVVVPDNGGRDFFGSPVPPDRPPAVGAHQPRE
ncbi:MAG: hypothetical protein JWO31_1780 [Phycisphaerales bacterium]|nr:hypothetical protein [Phycisphaerales bacterium]